MQPLFDPAWITARTDFVFRRITSFEEAQQSGRLRGEGYGRTAGMCRLIEGDRGLPLDLDAYDLRAHHYGLFARNSGEPDRLLGSIRVAGDAPGPQAEWIHRAAAGSDALKGRLSIPTPAPLPLLGYLEQSLPLRARYEQHVRAGERLAEPGRFTIHARAGLAAARLGLCLSSFVMCGAFAAGWHELSLDRVYLDCEVRMQAFYESFGFTVLPGGTACFQPALGISMTALEATPDMLPERLRAPVARLAHGLAARGEAVLDRAEPVFAHTRQREARAQDQPTPAAAGIAA